MSKRKNLKNMFSSPTKKRERTRLYPASYLKLGFVSDNADKKNHTAYCAVNPYVMIQ